jgi:diguanylate cyclase (GGDEF)-like protein
MSTRSPRTAPLPNGRVMPSVLQPTGSAWRRVFMGTDRQQQPILWRFVIGVLNCMTALLALNYGAYDGVIDADQCRLLTLTALAIQVGFYTVIRSGWNTHLKDPSLSEPMHMSVIGYLAWGYVIGGPGRPIALLFLFVILMFHMFVATQTWQLIRSCVFAGACFGAAMVYVGMTDHSAPYIGKLQLVYFVVMLAMLTTVSLLVTQLNALRARSTKRKNDLSKALAQVQHLATRDELTGLFNRRHMNDVLNIEKQRADRSGHGFTVCLIDVDLFKSVNDRFGHHVGDEVLQSLARALEFGLRSTDVVARWGGEEFLIVFTEVDQQAPETVLSRIRQHLEQTPVCRAQPELRVSFSAGLCSYHSHAPLHRVIEQADRALYQAKHGGRNRTETAQAIAMA